MRQVLRRIVALGVGFALSFILADLVLRFLPVSTGLRTQPVDAAHPVAHFEPGFNYTYSFGWDMDRVNHGHVNNAGFVNDQDYVADDPRPLLAIIGNSYIQAMMIPFRDTVEARLAASVGAKGRVYSFAQSGAPLSQYLVWADYAAHAFKASGIAIAVVDGNFDQSLLKYKRAPSQHYFGAASDGTLELQRVDYHPSTLRRLASRSALIRYLTLNESLMGSSMDDNGGRNVSGAAARADPAPEVVSDSYAAIAEFLKELPERTGLPPNRILLVVDAARQKFYADGTVDEDRYFTLMRTRLLAEAGAKGFETIDLDPVFAADWQAHHHRFDFADDGHWNDYGHGVVADAIAASRLYATLFGASGSPAKAAPQK